MLKKVCGLAFMLGLLVAAACGGDQFSVSDFEPGYCAAGNGGAPDSPDDCPAGAGGQAGSAGQAGATNKGGAAGNKAGSAGQAGQAGKAGAAGGSSSAGGKCCAGAAGTAGKAGQAGAGQAGIAGSGGIGGSTSGASGSGGAGQAGIAGSGGIGGSTSGASGSGGAGQAGIAGSGGSGGSTSGASGQAGAGQAGAAGDPGGSSGQGGSGGQPPVCGNGVIEAGESCEGSNFNGQTCATIKGPGWTGNLACLGCQTESAPCIPPPPSCLGGEMKTPTTMTVEAFNAGTTGLTAYELRYDGGETYDNVSPIEIDLMANNGPRILVAGGHNGIDAKLLNSAVAHPLYNADVETNNVAECQGALIDSQGCDHKIAKDLWCTLHANEQSNCSITTAFASLSNVKAYVVGNPGNTKVAWDVRCMQLPKYLSFSTSNLPRVATKFHRSIVQERSSVTPTVGQKTKSLSPRRLKISVGVF